jgi:hypothetical protein
LASPGEVRRPGVKTVTDILEQELATYEREKQDLLGRAEGKYVLIHGDEVIGTYDSEADAIAQGYRQFGNVAFLVKRIVEVDAPINFLTNKIAL